MIDNQLSFDQLRNLVIGTVESVSASELKVLLDTTAPQNTAINAGIPTLFPKINGYVLVPNEMGAVVGIISWMGVEYSQYPKRKGLRDFNLIDLPYPLRKLSISPLGILKVKDEGYYLERGVFSFPSVGDVVLMPTPEQLRAVVENKDAKATVTIGTSPLASAAPVRVDPDKLFGRHLAVLGNTGSGKSCSVAGLIRWSLNEASKAKKGQDINARFIILDPNGEYSNAFNDLNDRIHKFKVKLNETESGFEQLRIPIWMWNSYEWSSVTQATGRTQRPLLRRALRETRCGGLDAIDDEKMRLRRYYSSCLVSLRRMLITHEYKDEATRTGFHLKSIADDTNNKASLSSVFQCELRCLSDVIMKVNNQRIRSGRDRVTGEIFYYYNAFEEADIAHIITAILRFIEPLGGLLIYDGPDEDSPAPFKSEDLISHLEHLTEEQNALQWMDFFLMRINTMLGDTRMASVIGTEPELELGQWLEDYIGNDTHDSNIAIIDLSLVPSDVIHLVIAVIARIVFEALQRYRRQNSNELPTVLVMEEAHTFIKRYSNNSEDIPPEKMCCQVFERIAREGRKFGLGLLLSSQRPSELSETVLSQCNTFLLHRIVNDRDQNLVKRMIPDTLGGLLDELPLLPTRQAILLGWAAPLPVLVEMRQLNKEHCPSSHDPKYWDVWIGNETRTIDWSPIVKEWQQGGLKEEGAECNDSDQC